MKENMIGRFSLTTHLTFNGTRPVSLFQLFNRLDFVVYNLPKKILIFKGILVCHKHCIHLSENPIKVSSLYIEELVNLPDLSKTHLTVSLLSVKEVLAIISDYSVNSRFSLSPKFLLKVNPRPP
jgi:hypothetical protein